MDRTDITALRNAAKRVFADTPVFLAYAYGSRVHGTPRAASDLDVGYYLAASVPRRTLPLHDELALEAELTQAVGYDVDLRNLGTAPLEVRGIALELGVRLWCSDESARVALETALLARYHDYKPAFAAMHTARLAAFAEGA
jgi:predicted nucleotidyltransferase